MFQALLASIGSILGAIPSIAVLFLGVFLWAMPVFAEVSSAVTNGGGFSSLPQAVRDVYAKEVLFNAQPRLRFAQFAKVKQDLNAVRGRRVVFTKWANLEGGGYIEEGEKITTEGISASEISIEVKEFAKGVGVTELLLRTSHLEVMRDATVALGNNYAKNMDALFRDTVLATPNVIFGNQKASASALVAGDGLTTATIKDACELLANNNAPRYSTVAGDFYVCFASPHQLRQLRDDPDWFEVNKYNGRRQIYLGEVGMYEGVIFIETTQMPKLTTAQGVAKYGPGFTVANGWEAVIFGENAFGYAEALPVELREGTLTDFGRTREIAYYSIIGTGLIEDKNVVKILTA